jgi:peptidoglycan/LPS O-acetylase OafA/YrhL
VTTTYAIILACIAFMLVIGAVRGDPGRAVADTALLVILFGMITIVDIIFSQFMDTGDAAKSVAIAFAAGFALDALYGLMAPQRQRARDKKLRRLMKRRA